MAIYVVAIDGMSSHDAADVTRLETILVKQEGVVGQTGSDLQVAAQDTPEMTVKVSPGSCFVLRDSYANNDNTLRFWHVIVTATTNVTIPAADPTNPRIDLICVKVDTAVTPDALASNVATLVDVQGTAAGTPAAPAVPSNHLKLAEISVPALDTTISSGQITDYRVFIGLLLPYSGGYNLRDTGANADAQLYEDSAGKVWLLGGKSGGGIYIDQVSEKVMARSRTGGDVVPLATGESSLIFVIDGGGSAITTGIKGDLEVPFNCTVKGWTIVEGSETSGDIVVDIWKDTYANFPPTDADSIAGTELPTLSSGVKGQDLSLTTWSTLTLTKGEHLRFNVDSVTDVKRVTISLRVIKT